MENLHKVMTTRASSASLRCCFTEIMESGNGPDPFAVDYYDVNTRRCYTERNIRTYFLILYTGVR